MITADELLAAAFTGESLIVDVENRDIHIPDSITHFGVESDEDVMKLLFDMPRFYGDIDLSEFEININYKNANGYGDVFKVEEIVVGEELISFSWQIGRYVTAKAGNVKFNVCLKKYDASENDGVGQEFNTSPVELPVLQGLETGGSFTESYPNLYENLLSRIKYLEGLISAGGIGGGGIHTITGRWVLKSPVNLAGAVMADAVRNASIKTGTDYDTPIVGIVVVDDVGIGYALNTSDTGTIMVTDFNGNWVDEKYRYLDFGTGLNAPQGFYTWFMANATQAAPQVTYSISGKWILNPVCDLSGATGKCSIRDVNLKMGTTYNTPVYGIVGISDIGIAYSLDPTGTNTIMIADGSGILTNANYRYLDFGEGTIVSKEFHTWFVANAVQGVYEDVYNGDVDINDPNNPNPTPPSNPEGTTGTTYQVISSLTNCTSSNTATTIAKGAPYTTTLTPDSGFTFTQVAVFMGGAEITASVYLDGVIVINGATSDIIIVAKASNVDMVSVTNDLVGCNNTNAITTAVKGSWYEGILVAQDGLSMYSVVVTMGGVDITNDVYYDGKIIVNPVTDDIVITARTCSEDDVTVCNIEYELSRSTANNLRGEVNMGSSYSNIVSPDDGHAISSVVVTMGGKDVTAMVYRFDEEHIAGYINIGCVTGDITITVTSVAVSSRTLSGVWEMNSKVDISSSKSSQITGTTGTGEAFTRIIAFGTGLFYGINDVNVNVAPMSESGIGTFTNPSYRYLNFGATPQTVGEEFYKWFTANAVAR